MKKEDLIKLKEEVLKLDKPGQIERVLRYKTMYERFYEIAQDKPDSPAIYYLGSVFTYRQMLSLIDEAAKGFAEIGIGYNDVVAMSMLAEPNSIISLYALDKLGATMHMVNTLGSLDEIARELRNISSKYFVANDIFCSRKMLDVLDNVGIEKVVVSSLTSCMPMTLNKDKVKYELIEYLKGLRKKYYGDNVISYDSLLNLGRISKKKVTAVSFVPNKLVTLAYTSGSSGEAKACMATWEKIDAMIQVMGMTELGRFEDSDKMFTTFPLWIYYSLLNMIHEPLCLGVSLALDPVFNPRDIVRRNEQYKFNHWLTITPYIATMVKMNKKMDCSKWKIVLTGGSEQSIKLKLEADDYIKRNGGTVEILQGYGATEMLGSFAYSYHQNPTLGTLGVPCVGNKIKILDENTHEEVNVNEVGVGYLYSPAMMTGYYNDKCNTDHNLIKDQDGVIWYNTEDLLHQNDRGEIFFDDRLRRIVLTFDKNGNPTKLIPSRIERCIFCMEQVENCAVITVSDSKIENRAVAYVVPSNVENMTKKFRMKILETCQKNVPEYMIPSEIIFLESIPKLSSGKNDINTLKKMYSENQRRGKFKHKKR